MYGKIQFNESTQNEIAEYQYKKRWKHLSFSLDGPTKKEEEVDSYQNGHRQT